MLKEQGWRTLGLHLFLDTGKTVNGSELYNALILFGVSGSCSPVSIKKCNFLHYWKMGL